VEAVLLFKEGSRATGYGLLSLKGAGLNASFFFRNLQHANRSMTLLSAVTHPFLAQAATPPGGGGMFQILFLVFMFGAMYFLMIAPQRKKQKEHEKMLKALTTGDEVVTSGGIYGTITSVKEDRFIVRIADNAKIEIGKAFVHALVKKAGEEKK
jgi:preprotein translocase subunit YajC